MTCLAIIQQNNCAASMIEGGQYLQAIHILKAMLASIKEELRNEMAKEDQSEKLESALHQLILQRLKGRIGQEDMSLMYNQAVHIPLHVAVMADNAPAVVSSVLVFNFALAVHMSADSTRDTALRERQLAKALSLYRLVMAFNRSSTLVCMIVLNNVGLIHRAYNDHKRAEDCFNKLLAIWMNAPVQVKHLEGMLLNAMGWCNDLVLPAAAA